MRTLSAFQQFAFLRILARTNPTIIQQQQQQQQQQQFQQYINIIPKYHKSTCIDSSSLSSLSLSSSPSSSSSSSLTMTPVPPEENVNESDQTSKSSAATDLSATDPRTGTDERKTTTSGSGTTRTKLVDLMPPLPEKSRRIYLLRHGETDWNKLGKIQGGGHDIPLNDNGKLQAIASSRELDGIPLGVVASSHLLRSKETADILWDWNANTSSATMTTTTTEHVNTNDDNDKVKVPHRIIDEGFGEMRFGEYEGFEPRSPYVDPTIKAQFVKMADEVSNDITVPFSGGGESTAQVETRSTTALYNLLEEYTTTQHIAIVSHGRTNKVLLASVTRNDVSQFKYIRQGNTCINVMDVDENGNWTIQYENFIEHVRDHVIIR